MEKIIKANKILIFLFFIITISFYSCKKYEDNPAFGFVNAKKQITDGWTFTEFYVDGVDSMQYFKNTTKSEGYVLWIMDVEKIASKRFYQFYTVYFYAKGDYYKFEKPSLNAFWKIHNKKLRLEFVGCNFLRETYYKTDSCYYYRTVYPFNFYNPKRSFMEINIDKLYKHDLWLSFEARNKKYKMKFKR